MDGDKVRTGCLATTVRVSRARIAALRSVKSARPARLVASFAALTLALASFLATPATARAQASAAPSSSRIAGVSLVAPRRPAAPGRMEEVKALGAGWVAVVPYAFVRRNSGRVVFGRDGQFWGEREEGIRAQVAAARARGMKVLLKPHLWSRGDAWIGEYAPADSAGWRAFEESYRDYILGAARLAEELRVEMLCVGTELTRVVSERPHLLRRLISDVRSVYQGRLTYAANWDSYADVPFWDALDYIGIDAYFPLSRKPEPTVADIRRGWAPVTERLANYSRKVGRPVLFTEYGYRSMAGAAGRQWALPDVRSTDPARADYRAQSRAYEAFFRSVWDQPWFAGGFLWKWYLQPMKGPRWDRVTGTGYTPQGKPAQKVVAHWYRGSEATTSPGRDRR